jgi:hypothetical protein
MSIASVQWFLRLSGPVAAGRNFTLSNWQLKSTLYVEKIIHGLCNNEKRLSLTKQGMIY